MTKRSKNKPGSPTEPVSTDVVHVQDDTSESPVMSQEMNKPFMLVLSVPHNEGLSAVFPCAAIETSIFPVNHDNDAVHTFIVDKITDMTCDAMKTHFKVKARFKMASIGLLKAITSAMPLGQNTSDSWHPNAQATTTLPLCLPPTVINAFVWILPLVFSFGCVHPKNSSTISQISCVSHSKTILATNSLTRLTPSFLWISMEPSSSASNLALLRNVVSPMFCAKIG